jgi:hypothetical protein
LLLLLRGHLERSERPPHGSKLLRRLKIFNQQSMFLLGSYQSKKPQYATRAARIGFCSCLSPTPEPEIRLPQSPCASYTKSSGQRPSDS